MEAIIPQSARLSEKCPITLLPHQKEHVRKVWHHLVKDKQFSYINTSHTGLGKTHDTLCIAWHLQKLYGTKVMIIAPSDTSLTNEDGWIHHAKEYGVELVDSMPYSTLRGARGKVSHKWLSVDPEDKKKWTATSAFEQLCANGLFLIFDEFHKTKNLSMSHFASAALVKMAKKYPGSCRVALLSHTPASEVDSYPQLLRMAGIITNIRLFKHVPFTHEYKWEEYGLGELANFCIFLSNKNERNNIIQIIGRLMEKVCKARANGICKELYDTYIRKHITFAMPVPEVSAEVTLQNAFFGADEESVSLLRKGLELLKEAVNWRNGEVDVTAPNLGQITTSLRLLERGKLGIIAKYVNQEVSKNPNKKFVICCGSYCLDHQTVLAKMIHRSDNYDTIIDELKKENPNWQKLPKDIINIIKEKTKYNSYPVILNGETKKRDRVKILSDFQSNNKEVWCLIISPSIGSESISLHDRFGDHPRDMLIVPTYYWTQMVQASGRIVRAGRRSPAKVMMVYSKQIGLETKILDALARKSQIGRELIAEGQKVMYPGDFPTFTEQ
jgi:hypothetical protein